MKTVFGVLLLFIASFALAQESLLISPQWLNEHKSDPNLVIIQPNGMKMDYDAEHIAGARYIWPNLLSPDSPQGAMNAPDLDQANELLGSLGISNNSTIVICHTRNEVSQSARLFLTLEHLGMKGKVLYLNGGLEAWKKAGFPVTAEVPVIKKVKFKAVVNPLLVDKDYVKQRLNSSSTIIVDARAKGAYDGDPVGQPRDGHIASAKNIPFLEMIDQTTYAFKPSDQLQAYFTPVASKDKELVAYCYIGQTASVVFMAGRILGYNMKLYDGSIQEWSHISDLPMEKTEKKIP